MIIDQILTYFKKIDSSLLLESEETPVSFISVLSDRWSEAAKLLKEYDDFLFDSLQCITGVDLGNDSLEVRYNLHSMEKRHTIEVRIACEKSNPHIQSIESIWQIGNWFEREVYDMFGIIFDGHPDLTRILLPEDWIGWPLRKDYIVQPTYHGIVVPKVKDGWE